MYPKLIILFLFQLLSFSYQKAPHRRVFFGTPHSDFHIPYSSVVTIRNRLNNWETGCSGVLISPTQVLTAEHCVKGYIKNDYRIGYGSSIIEQQSLTNVKHKCVIKEIDAALLVIEQIPLNTSRYFKYHSEESWSMDDLKKITENKTFMCGFGKFEGPNRDKPERSDTPVVRCLDYRFSGNFETIKKEAMNIKSHWPKPKDGYMYDHNSKYMVSLSRHPDQKSKPYFATACEFDSGGPVFYRKDNGEFLLQGIFHYGPPKCGNATIIFDYDYAVLMKPIMEFIKENPDC